MFDLLARGKQRVETKAPSCGYAAEIIRSVDQGKTWTKVFSESGPSATFYFNSITCADEFNCIAVGEGFDARAGVHAYVTHDGVNWRQTLRVNDRGNSSWSFFSVDFSDTYNGVAWIGGTEANQETQTAQGVFFITRDFGRTWARWTKPQAVPGVGGGQEAVLLVGMFRVLLS